MSQKPAAVWSKNAIQGAAGAAAACGAHFLTYPLYNLTIRMQVRSDVLHATRARTRNARSHNARTHARTHTRTHAHTHTRNAHPHTRTPARTHAARSVQLWLPPPTTPTTPHPHTA